MRGLIGLCLLITGLSIGAYSHYPGPTHREASLVELTEIVTGAIHKPSELGSLSRSAHAAGHKPRLTNRTQHPTAQAVRETPPAASSLARTSIEPFQRRGWFANSKILQADSHAAPRGNENLETVASVTRTAALEQPLAARTLSIKELPTMVHTGVTPPQPTAGGWRTAIVHVDAAPNANKQTSSLKTQTSAERWQLVKSIQSELKRVGCYWGRVDGVWGKGSKWAMADFMRAVNAALPTQDPDYIQLKLISSQATKVCGRTIPHQQIAARIKPAPVTTKWRAKIARADSVRRSDERTTDITTGAVPSQAQAPVAAAHNRRRAPLPGRMAVGALSGPPQRAVRPAVRKSDIKVSALARANADIEMEGRQPVVDQNGDRIQPKRQIKRSQQLNPFVAPKRSAAKAKRAKALRKANVRKQTRRRYRKRRYRRRSIQSLFTHPLGRR